MKNRHMLHKILIGMLVIASVILSVRLVAFSNRFYIRQYEKLKTAQSMNLSEEDLSNATNILLDYIKGDVDSIDLKVTLHNQEVEMFNQKEKDHMIDVKNLYDVANFIMLSFFGVNIIAFGYNRFKKITLSQKERKKILKDVYTVLGLGFSGLILFVLTNFDLFWTTFHKVLFSNDLWLLDPQTDRMINMFPLPFFNAMVMKIIVTFILLNILFAIFYTLDLKKEDKK